MDMLLYAILNKKIKNSGGGSIDLSEYAKKEDLVGLKTDEGGEIFNDYENNIATTNSHAEGINTKAYGNGSHAEGVNTTATGINSHAEGQVTKASGHVSHAEGSNTVASGDYSHTEGEKTYASTYSHAEGQGTKAYGTCSHTEGCYTIAYGDYSHVQGKYNIEDRNNKYAFIIGNGENNNNRSNAIAIDWDGLIYLNNSDTGIDLSNLPAKEEVAQAVEYAHTHQNKTTLNKITAAKFESWETAVQQIGDIQTVLENIVEVSE